uniref:IS30 family transposase n=1 Tax=Colwellia sp. UCD-KL20 TaxID=1917165 RepID=UPI001177CD6C
FDNGREFYAFEKVKKALDADIYFADPYSSWQRGTNEHSNGMLRRYYKKGTSIENITNRQVRKTVDIINNRPRKILGYRSASEVYQAG